MFKDVSHANKNINKISQFIKLHHSDQRILTLKFNEQMFAMFHPIYSLTNLARNEASPEKAVQIVCELIKEHREVISILQTQPQNDAYDLVCCLLSVERQT
jgi:hypothetical protein